MIWNRCPRKATWLYGITSKQVILAGYYSAGLYDVANSVKNVTQAFSMEAKGAVKIDACDMDHHHCFKRQTLWYSKLAKKSIAKGRKKNSPLRTHIWRSRDQTGIFILKLRTYLSFNDQIWMETWPFQSRRQQSDFSPGRKQKLSFAVSRVTQGINGCIDPVLSLLNRLPGEAEIHSRTIPSLMHRPLP